MNTQRPPETVRAYLAELRHALKGAPRGLIADALADCEEHLNNEIAQNPEADETAVLASVVETYGTPEEIAEAYRAMEASISTPFPKAKPVRSRRGGFFAVVSDPQSYGALVYMLLALMTGVFYFTWTVVGIAITVGCSLLIFGIPFALLFVGSVRLLSHVEGRIVEGLLDRRMPRRLPAATQADETLWTRIKDALLDMRTWTSMFYLLSMLPLGIAYFVAATVGLCLSLGTSGAAVYSLATNKSVFSVETSPVIDHLLHTAPGLIAAVVLGVLLFFCMLHLARIVGRLHGRIAEVLLVRL